MGWIIALGVIAFALKWWELASIDRRARQIEESNARTRAAWDAAGLTL